MTLIKWRPVNNFAAEFVNMQREIDRMFDRFHGGMIDNGETSTWLPAIDVVENQDDYVVKAELPGVDKNDVKITVHNDVLTIRGEKKSEKEEKENSYHRIERSFGVFQRSFALPKPVQNEKIEASYDNGVLTVRLPKVKEAKPKEIEVKVK